MKPEECTVETCSCVAIYNSGEPRAVRLQGNVKALYFDGAMCEGPSKKAVQVNVESVRSMLLPPSETRILRHRKMNEKKFESIDVTSGTQPRPNRSMVGL